MNKSKEPRLIDESHHILRQSLAKAKRSYDAEFRSHLQELNELKEKYKLIATQTFGAQSISHAFQATPVKKPRYDSPIIKSEPPARARRNPNPPNTSPYTAKTPQRSSRLISSNYAQLPVQPNPRPQPTRLPTPSKSQPTQTQSTTKPTNGAKDGFYSLIDQVNRELSPDPRQLPPNRNSVPKQPQTPTPTQPQPPTPVGTPPPHPNAARRHSVIQSLLDETLKELDCPTAGTVNTKIEAAKKKKERLSQILTFKKEKAEKRKKSCEGARKAVVEKIAKHPPPQPSAGAAPVPPAPAPSPSSSGYVKRIPILHNGPTSPTLFAPSPLKRASTAFQLSSDKTASPAPVVARRALSPEQKSILKEAKGRLMGSRPSTPAKSQIGEPRNFERAATELIFTEDDQPVLIEVKDSPDKRKSSLSKRKRASFGIAGGELEITTRKAALVNCQIPILQRATFFDASDDEEEGTGSPKKMKLDLEPAKEVDSTIKIEREIADLLSAQKQVPVATLSERITARLNEQEKKEDQEKELERQEREERRRLLKEQLRQHREGEKKHEEPGQRVFEQKEEGSKKEMPASTIPVKTDQQKLGSIYFTSPNVVPATKSRSSTPSTEGKEKAGAVAAPRLKGLTKERPVVEGKRLPSLKEKRAQIRRMSTKRGKASDEVRSPAASPLPVTGRKRKSVDDEEASAMTAAPTTPNTTATPTKLKMATAVPSTPKVTVSVASAIEEDKNQTIREKLKRRSSRKPTTPSPVTKVPVIRNLQAPAASPQQQRPLSPLRVSLASQNRTGAGRGYTLQREGTRK